MKVHFTDSVSWAKNPPFTQETNADDCTFWCPCGAVTSNPSHGNWWAIHKPHTNGWIEETITEDGARFDSGPRQSRRRAP